MDAIVSTAGGVEEDFVKCVGETYLGEFSLPGKDLRAAGINRIGNLLVPNNNYGNFEDFMTPVLDACVAGGGYETPSTFIQRLGTAMQDDRSVYHWCARRGIPVFCPALTDGSMGDMMFFHSFRKKGLIIDVLPDVGRLRDLVAGATEGLGVLMVGTGLPKHHVLRACRMAQRPATDVVLITTGHLHEGGVSSCNPEVDIANGDIHPKANVVVLRTEATLVFPVLVSAIMHK